MIIIADTAIPAPYDMTRVMRVPRLYVLVLYKSRKCEYTSQHEDKKELTAEALYKKQKDLNNSQP
jgi:hypothetical protein